MTRLLGNPLAPPVLFSLATGTVLGGYVVAGMPIDAGGRWLVETGWSLMMVLWMYLDARRRLRLPCFDFGFLAILTFPVSLVWYCIWSRGWGAGLLWLIALFGLWTIPWLLAVCLWILISVVRVVV